MKLSGVQRKVLGALTFDDPANGALSPTKSLKRLQRESLYVHNWQVCKDFVYEEDGVETTEFITGKFKSAKLKNGRLKFDDDDELFMHVLRYTRNNVLVDFHQSYEEFFQLVGLVLPFLELNYADPK
ncbi:hypothetical protein GN958_ATG05329 [Phytophthora infestans]|uniref:Uncharacterized protein n=1 Tax=Phytophthora infestans TaxID=4787 RepID=A0A8S9UWQ7_PHYIN|nr:hypothetical protein GN958_ATG05329 [Phytophthora infestans]KAI9986842.1 hypothetical protein PInf_025811 [Phytophthora infestans]